MKKLLALLMVLCLGMFVVACGPTADDQPAGDDTGVETPEGGEETPEGGAEGDDSSEGELETLPDLTDPTPDPLTIPDEPEITPPTPGDGS